LVFLGLLVNYLH
jgi:hypothetical protein